jgi:hypothetical protein
MCTECVAIQEAMTSAVHKDARAKAQRQYDEHRAMYRGERQAYYRHRELAMQEPTKYLSLIVDGADQSCHKFPRFATKVISLITRWARLTLGHWCH